MTTEVGLSRAARGRLEGSAAGLGIRAVWGRPTSDAAHCVPPRHEPASAARIPSGQPGEGAPGHARDACPARRKREDDDVGATDVEAVERPAGVRVRGDVSGGGAGGVRDARREQPRWGGHRGWRLGDGGWRALQGRPGLQQDRRARRLRGAVPGVVQGRARLRDQGHERRQRPPHRGDRGRRRRRPRQGGHGRDHGDRRRREDHRRLDRVRASPSRSRPWPRTTRSSSSPGRPRPTP